VTYYVVAWNQEPGWREVEDDLAALKELRQRAERDGAEVTEHNPL
jgi:hypothetical protein